MNVSYVSTKGRHLFFFLKTIHLLFNDIFEFMWQKRA